MKAGSSGSNVSGLLGQRRRGHFVHDLSYHEPPCRANERAPSIATMFALTQGLRRAVQIKPNGPSTAFATPPPNLASDAGPRGPRRRRAFRTGRESRRQGRHPGAEQRPLFRVDVRDPLDRRRHGAAQHSAGDAGDRVRPGRFRRRGAVHRRRDGSSPDGRWKAGSRACARSSGSTTSPRPTACCTTRTSRPTNPPTTSSRPTTTSPVFSTPAARRVAPKA